MFKQTSKLIPLMESWHLTALNTYSKAQKCSSKNKSETNEVDFWQGVGGNRAERMEEGKGVEEIEVDRNKRVCVCVCPCFVLWEDLETMRP